MKNNIGGPAECREASVAGPDQQQGRLTPLGSSIVSLAPGGPGRGHLLLSRQRDQRGGSRAVVTDAALPSRLLTSRARGTFAFPRQRVGADRDGVSPHRDDPQGAIRCVGAKSRVLSVVLPRRVPGPAAATASECSTTGGRLFYRQEPEGRAAPRAAWARGAFSHSHDGAKAGGSGAAADQRAQQDSPCTVEPRGTCAAPVVDSSTEVMR